MVEATEFATCSGSTGMMTNKNKHTDSIAEIICLLEDCKRRFHQDGSEKSLDEVYAQIRRAIEKLKKLSPGF